MADTGAVFPTNAGVKTSIGTLNWSNTSYICADDTNYASAYGATGAYTYYIYPYTYGFSIPSGATINGIEAVVAAYHSGAMNCPFYSVKIVKADGSLGSTSLATGSLTTSMATYTFGGSTSLWGETWTYSDINDSDFGVAMAWQIQSPSAKYIYVDYITLKIYYTESGGSSISQKVFWF